MHLPAHGRLPPTLGRAPSASAPPVLAFRAHGPSCCRLDGVLHGHQQAAQLLHAGEKRCATLRRRGAQLVAAAAAKRGVTVEKEYDASSIQVCVLLRAVVCHTLCAAQRLAYVTLYQIL